MKYRAFISYRHLEPDRTVAVSVHRLLEKYTVPSRLRGNGEKHLGRIFRDEDELPLSVSLSDSILAALEEKRAAGRKNVLVCGTEAHVCVFQTCLDLKALGFQPVLVTDAIASRKKTDKKIALQRAVQEGILLTTAEAVLFELTLDSRHPRFREISALVK